ncbi:hypothetical protein [Flavobacterium chilense]|uniref:Leucine-rich repeat domain-containing protein n=1 Tax=Flavobacterium chilense TaxID=946677 RepID=A0A1M7F090_9FLAO|nr:hypothetical protein [Flavobacterium chilense]SHL97383.1 hypothetical protein SAMN05444484_103164 [Flavobacterium chilense]
MNWNNYLLEGKAPSGDFAHLGSYKDAIRGIFDLSEIPKDTVFLEMSTPLKKFKLKYTNLSSLKENDKIEAISLGDIDEERISVFSTISNLKYLKLSINQQDKIPDLSSLKSVEVLVLANIKKVQNIDFLTGMKSLKTLYIFGINNLYDLTPISSLINLQELFIHHGKISGTGKLIKSISPLKSLTELKYLYLNIAFEEKKVDLSLLYEMKKLQEIALLPRYLKNEQWEALKKELPLIQ